MALMATGHLTGIAPLSGKVLWLPLRGVDTHDVQQCEVDLVGKQHFQKVFC